MAANDIFIYTNATSVANAVITSNTVTTAASFPDLVLGDSPTYNFRFTDGSAAPSWAGNAQYSIEWALGTSGSDDSVVLAYQTQATAITGGWTMVLPLNTGAILSQLNSARASQEYPVVRLWQQVRVTDPSGYKTTYATIRTNLRLRTVPNAQPVPDDPLPSGYTSVIADATGKLAAPGTFFEHIANIGSDAGDDLTLTANGGAQVVLKAGYNGNIVLTPKSTGGSGSEFIQGDAEFSGTQSSNVYGFRMRYTLAHAGTNENITWANGALLGEISTESDNEHSYSNRQTGTYSYINHHGAGQLGLPIGSYAVIAARGAGGMGTARAFDAHMFTENIAGTGAVTSMTGFNVRTVTETGGAIGTIYGLYVDEQTAAGTNWAVYTNGATPSYFGGQVTFANWIVGCTTGSSQMELGADARTENLGVRINTAAGKNRYFAYYSAGVLRWFQAVDLTAESGANAGSDYKLQAYDDAGSLIGTALAITRSTMAATFGGALTVTGATTLAGGLVSYGANDSGGTGYRLVRVPNT